MAFYVYYLLSAVNGELLYVGRSNKPKRRQTAFHKLHHVLTEMGFCQRYESFEEACRAEVIAIEKHKPPFNKLVTSSPGAFGYRHEEEARERMLVAAKKPKSEATKAAMKKPKSQAHRQAMRKPKSPEHRAKLAEVLVRSRAARHWQNKKER